MICIVDILLCVADLIPFDGDPNHGFDLITFISQLTGLIALAALGFAYTARYEQHKAAGPEDKSYIFHT